ncbi:MAG TPA: PIN domain-containing protein [Candidatus Dormibacteraeota bacterium]
MAHPQAPTVTAPEAVAEEILEHLPAIARKRGLDLGVLLPVLAALPVEWRETSSYAALEAEARRRMAQRDVDDWPTVALALALSETTSALAIWTQDRDFVISRLETLTTGQLLDLLEGRHG